MAPTTKSRNVTKTTKAEQSQATRAALLATARRLFTEHGYAATTTDEIVRESGVTRGALYYHFRDKTAIFRAVDEELEAELARAVVAAAAGEADPWDQVAAGAEAFLDAAAEDRAIRQVVLLDAPSVLGWELWRQIDAEHGLGLLVAGVEAAMDAGIVERQPVRPLAHVLMGAMSEACLVIAAADDPGTVRDEVVGALRSLLDGLRRAPGPLTAQPTRR